MADSRRPLETNSESHVELPAWRRSVEGTQRRHFDWQPTSIHAQATADATDLRGLRPTRPHRPTVGEEEDVGGNGAIVELPRQHAPQWEAQLDVGDEQSAAEQFVAAVVRRIGTAVAKIQAMPAHEVVRTEITR